jgi:cell division protein FtsQ
MKKRRQNELLSSVTRARMRKRTTVIYCINVLLLVSLCCGIYSLGSWLHRSNMFKLKKFNISTSGNYVSSHVFLRLIKNQVQGGFFSYDADALKAKLLHNPWVKTVHIRRVFPDSLNVVIQERQPVAVWNKKAILTHSGAVFYPREMSKLDFPRFAGGFDSRYIILNEYKLISQQLLPLKLKVSSLSLSERKAWMLTLSNGISINVGRGEVADKIKRFVLAYPHLKNANLRVGAVDLRYPNGFAVKWVL